MSEGEPEAPGTANRRRERRPIAMRGFLVRGGGITQAIELVDLNYGGCGILTLVELTPGESVKLTVLGRGAMPAEVRWYKDGKAGLDFEAALETPKTMVERAADRVEVPGEIGLRAAGKIPYRVRVLDLSTDGCRVELVELPRIGDQMRVKFDGLELLEADVCWVEGHSAGLKFQHHIHPAVLDLLVARLRGD
jgi:hypothetical protein